MDKVKGEEMQEALAMKAQAVEWKNLLNEKYMKRAQELTTKQNLDFLHMKDLIELEVETKKIQLLKEHEFALEQIGTKLRIDLLSYERDICDCKNELKIQNSLDAIHEENDLEVRLNELIRKQVLASQEELSKIGRETIDLIISEQKKYNDILINFEDKKDTLLKLKGRFKYLISEYTQALKAIPVITLDDLNTLSKNADLALLQQELNEKEEELSPARRSSTLAATLTVEHEMNALKMKEILLYIFNEKNFLEKQRRMGDVLNKFAQLIGNGNSEWKSQLSRSSVTGFNKATIRSIEREILSQEQAVNSYSESVQYCIFA
eukprot:TRINITY_DN7396_c0_g5_i1.p1 TRINITY_DN7396_c0_g5~~TRINITY_DN7396_c0_g5_i1.p1  ORF type:complete len:321 (-),score=65.12 TRINITY_DN7396_c0_g5_i1:287-1249(-)